MIATTLALFFGTLVAFFIIRSAKTHAIVLAALMLAGALYLLAEATGNSILFTGESLVVTRFWFRRFTERYTDVRRVTLKAQAIQLYFVDGRCAKFYRDLGNTDKVIAYLEARLPESVLSAGA